MKRIGAPLCLFAALLVPSDAFARGHCRPMPWRDGRTVLMCSESPDYCMTLRDGDECNGLERSAECTTREAMYCFAEYPPNASSGIQCFADRATCQALQSWVTDVEGGETSRCERVVRGTPYHLYRRIVPRRAQTRATPR